MGSPEEVIVCVPWHVLLSMLLMLQILSMLPMLLRVVVVAVVRVVVVAVVLMVEVVVVAVAVAVAVVLVFVVVVVVVVAPFFPCLWSLDCFRGKDRKNSGTPLAQEGRNANSASCSPPKVPPVHPLTPPSTGCFAACSLLPAIPY